MCLAKGGNSYRANSLQTFELVELQAAQTTGQEKCIQRNMRPHEFVTQHVLGLRTFTSGLLKTFFGTVWRQ